MNLISIEAIMTEMNHFGNNNLFVRKADQSIFCQKGHQVKNIVVVYYYSSLWIFKKKYLLKTKTFLKFIKLA